MNDESSYSQPTHQCTYTKLSDREGDDFDSNAVGPPWRDLSYLALVDVELDGVFVDDGVKLVDEDVLEVDEHLVDPVEPPPPLGHGVKTRRVGGHALQVARAQDLFGRTDTLKLW